MSQFICIFKKNVQLTIESNSEIMWQNTKTNNRKRFTKDSDNGTIRLDCALICLGNIKDLIFWQTIGN